MWYLDAVKRQLDMPPAEKAEVMLELESHFIDIRDELVASGMDADEAERLAGRRLGRPEDVGTRLNAAHNTASWESAALCALPLAVSALFVLLTDQAGLTIRVVVAVICAFLSIREIVRGRRPVWLGPVLAVAMLGAGRLIASLVSQGMAGPPNGERILGTLAMIGALCIAATVAAWRTPPWRRAMVAIWVLCLPCIVVLVTHGWLYRPLSAAETMCIMVPLLTCPAQLLLFALVLFENHPHGNGTRASLFLFALLVVGALDTSSHSSLTAGAVLACIPAVVWLARAPQQKHKHIALTLAFVLFAVVSRRATLSFFDPDLHSLTGQEPSLFFGYLIVVLPIWRGNVRRRTSGPRLAL